MEVLRLSLIVLEFNSFRKVCRGYVKEFGVRGLRKEDWFIGGGLAVWAVFFYRVFALVYYVVRVYKLVV